MPAAPTPEPQVGQIWREVDPRRERFVRIEHIGLDVGIRTVVRDGNLWFPASGSRLSDAASERFNGKRGGYEFVEA